MTRLARVILVTGTVSSLILLAVLAAGGGERLAKGATAQGGITMGIDPDTTGNTASTLGTVEDCVEITVPNPAFDDVSDYNIDVYVSGDTQTPIGYDAWVTYDSSIVHIADPGTDTKVKISGANVSTSEARPDADGTFVSGELFLWATPDIGVNTFAGDGTLVRLGLDIGGSGVVTFDFDPAPAAAAYASEAPDGWPSTQVHPVTRKTAKLAINTECPPAATPTAETTPPIPTSSPARTPAATISPTPPAATTVEPVATAESDLEGEMPGSEDGFPWVAVYGGVGGLLAAVLITSILYLRVMRRSR